MRSPIRIFSGLRREAAAGIYGLFSRLMPHSEEQLAQDSTDEWEHKESGNTGSLAGSHWLNQGGGWTDTDSRQYGEFHLQ